MDNEPGVTMHARTRAIERFGVLLDQPGAEEIIADIEAGDATYFRSEGHSELGVHLVVYRGVRMGVAYCPARRTIVTVMHVKPNRRARG